MVKILEHPDGTKSWWLNGQIHREDGPAMLKSNGTEFWYKNGLLHREDGPAIIFPDGRKEWWFNDVKYTFKEWIQIVNINNEEKMELILYYG